MTSAQIPVDGYRVHHRDMDYNPQSKWQTDSWLIHHQQQRVKVTFPLVHFLYYYCITVWVKNAAEPLNYMTICLPCHSFSFRNVLHGFFWVHPYTYICNRSELMQLNLYLKIRIKTKSSRCVRMTGRVSLQESEWDRWKLLRMSIIMQGYYNTTLIP